MPARWHSAIACGTLARSGSALGAGLYDAASSERTYARLAICAAAAVRSGYSVIVDAAFLRHEERDRLRRLALRLGAEFLIVSCEARDAVLRERVARRAVQASDASEAQVPVLERQFVSRQPLTTDEAAATVCVNTGRDACRSQGVEGVASRLAGRRMRII